MFIHKLRLTNFKNHQKRDFLFSEKTVAFVGLNGVGKTNILDAIYTLSMGKSYFSSTDKTIVKSGESFYRISMELDESEFENVTIVYEQGKRKKILLDEVPLTKIAEHLGNFPVVIVSPNDQSLILGNSDERRKYMDSTLSQLSKTYLLHLIAYNNVLKQRNALLKQAEEKGLDEKLLAIYNDKMSDNAQYIYEQRKSFFSQIQPYFKASFQALAAKDEGFEMDYASHLAEGDLKSQLNANLQKDLILRRTNKGIHRDDIKFRMKGASLKEFGSQGQQKTFLLALKLTQFNFLKAQLNKVPLFIVDDIFDKLDEERSKNLVKFIIDQPGQVFISHTDSHVFQDLLDIKVQLIPIE